MGYYTTDQFKELSSQFELQGGDPLELLSAMDSRGDKIQGYNDDIQTQQSNAPQFKSREDITLENNIKPRPEENQPNETWEGVKGGVGAMLDFEEKYIRKPMGRLNKGIVETFNPISQGYKKSKRPEEQPWWSRIPEELAGEYGETFAPVPTDYAANKLIGGLVKGAANTAGFVSKKVLPKVNLFKNSLDKQIIDVANKHNIELPLGATIDNYGLRGAEVIASKGFFGKKVSNIHDNALQSIMQKTDDYVNSIDLIKDPSSAGDAIFTAIKDITEKTKKFDKNLYSSVNLGQAGQNIVVNLNQTKALIDTYKTQLEKSGFKNTKLLDDLDELLEYSKGKVSQSKLILKGGLNRKPVTADSVKQTIIDLNEDLLSNKTEAFIKTGSKEKLSKITGALKEDLFTALQNANPNLAKSLKQADNFHYEMLKKLETKFTQRIASLENQPDKIFELIKNPKTGARDLALVREALEGTNSLKQVQAAFVNNMVKEAASKITNTIPTGGMARQIAKYDDKLKVILEPKQYDFMNEVSALSIALGKTTTLAKGSQTAFLQRLMNNTLVNGALAWGTNLLVPFSMLMTDYGISKLFTNSNFRSALNEGFYIPLGEKTLNASAPKLGALGYEAKKLMERNNNQEGVVE